MPKVRTTRWDTADYLTTDAEITAYLEAASEDGDPELIEHAMGNVRRARKAMEEKLETRFTPPPEAEMDQWRFVARTETDPATGREHVRETWVRADQFDRYQRRRFPG